MGFSTIGDFSETPATGASDAFKTVSVSGQSDVVADSSTDSLTLVNGRNVTITTNAGADSVTVAAADTNTQLSTEQVQDIVGGMVTGNTETNITVTYQDGDGTLDFAVTSGGGKVLQVIQTVKTDTFTTTSAQGTFTDVTGMAVAITPASDSNKVLVIVSMTGSGSLYAINYRLLRATSELGLGADHGGNRNRTTFSSSGDYDTSGDTMNTATYVYLDSPSSTSEETYKIQCSHRSTGTASINRTATTTDSAWLHAGTSTITVMEIEG